MGEPRLSKKLKNTIINRAEGKLIDKHGDIVEIIRKTTPFDRDNDVLNIMYRVTVRVIFSQSDGTYEGNGVRSFNGTYQGVIGDTEYLFKHLTINTDRKIGLFKKNVNTAPKVLLLRYSTLYDVDNEDDAYDFEEALSDGSFFDPTTLKEVDEIDSNLTESIILSCARKYTGCTLVLDKVNVYTKGTEDPFDLRHMKLKAVIYDDISTNLFNEIVNIKNDNDANCVINCLTFLYGNNEKRRGINVNSFFEDYDISNGIDTCIIIEFCEKYNIKCIAYNVHGLIIASHYPTKRNTTFKTLIYIAHNEHMYLIKNKVLNKKFNIFEYVNAQGDKNGGIEQLKRLTSNECTAEFNKLLFNHILPADVYIRNYKKDTFIQSFVHDKTMYYTNDDYDDCFEILKLFGIQDQIKPFTTRFNIMHTLEELYGTLDNFSFFPSLDDYVLTPFKYHTSEKNIDESKLTTIDKVKAYPYALSILPFVICGDERNIIIRDCNDETKIIESYTYYIETSESSDLLPTSGIYDGWFLLKVKNIGLPFKLIKEYQTNIRDNKYTKLVDDYYTKTLSIRDKLKDKDIIKMIFNIWLGKLERPTEETAKLKINAICTKEQSKLTDGYIIPYNDIYDFSYTSQKNYRLYNRKLLKMQIMNMSRLITYEKMVELKLKDDDIIQINVDSITFKTKPNRIMNNIDKDDYKSWKLEEYKTIDDDSMYISNRSYIGRFPSSSNISNRLYKGYAGCGKSYKIRNEIIPNLIKLNQTFIVISPSHSSLEEYRNPKTPTLDHNGNIIKNNCDVIQKYVFSNTIPKEDVIIVDEIGLCDKKSNDVIYKCYLSGKVILSFGDFSQLIPPGEDRPFNNEDYIRIIYNKCILLHTNHRNNFTLDYYDSLINNKIDLMEEIKKYSTKHYYDSECIICTTNKQCHKWNKKYMEYHNIKFGEIGFKTICKTNKYRKYNIYNNFIMTITDKDDKFVTLDNVFKIPVKKFIERKMNDKGLFSGIFGAGYARTQYNVQGKSLKSFYVPSECYNAFNNGRSAYTIISRLEEELTTERQNDQPIKIIETTKKDVLFRLTF